MGVAINRNDQDTVDVKTIEQEFWSAQSEQTFPPEVISVVFGVSMSWLQKKRCTGGGIPFSKIHYRKIVYSKADILEYFDKTKMTHTA